MLPMEVRNQCNHAAKVDILKLQSTFRKQKASKIILSTEALHNKMLFAGLEKNPTSRHHEMTCSGRSIAL